MEGELFPRPVLSVTELTRTLRALIEEQIGSVWVEGEVCNHRRQSSGHQYFTLKDDKCQLPCVLFQRPVVYLRQPLLADGMQVQLHGEMTVYEGRGHYQLNVRKVQAAGSGLLLAKFEALKKKLQAEGLFDASAKKALPKFPSAIGIVTSPTGAAVQDILNVLERRAPWLHIIIHPVRVQGDGAAEEIAAAVAGFNRFVSAGRRIVDLIVVCRGGGSAEDLWEFNEEVLARAIFASELPVVSAVGHEVDFTMADFVADLRAPTPSAAAELIAPDAAELSRRFSQIGAALRRHVLSEMERARARLAYLAKTGLFTEPSKRLAEATQRLDWATEEMHTALQRATEARKGRVSALLSRLERFRPHQLVALKQQQSGALARRLGEVLRRRIARENQRLARIESLLRVLSPNATLERGYTITTTAAGALLGSAADVEPGAELVTRFRDGNVPSRVL